MNWCCPHFSTDLPTLNNVIKKIPHRQAHKPSRQLLTGVPRALPPSINLTTTNHHFCVSSEEPQVTEIQELAQVILLADRWLWSFRVGDDREGASKIGGSQGCQLQVPFYLQTWCCGRYQEPGGLSKAMATHYDYI